MMLSSLYLTLTASRESFNFRVTAFDLIDTFFAMVSRCPIHKGGDKHRAINGKRQSTGSFYRVSLVEIKSTMKITQTFSFRVDLNI